MVPHLLFIVVDCPISLRELNKVNSDACGNSHFKIAVLFVVTLSIAATNPGTIEAERRVIHHGIMSGVVPKHGSIERSRLYRSDVWIRVVRRKSWQ